MEIAFASNNKHKLEEVRQILSGLPLTIHSLADLGLEVEISEDGQTFRENALIKAHLAAKASGMISLADDSGLEVDALNGAPGVRSARFAGDKADSSQNNKLLLEKLKNVPFDQRTARFRCVLALVTLAGEEHLWDGTCEGLIGFEEHGQRGFGYDPLFILPAYQKTLAELGPEIKNKLSHRAMALKNALPYLTRIIHLSQLIPLGEG